MYIGATTLNEYRQYIEKDGALERRFQMVYMYLYACMHACMHTHTHTHTHTLLYSRSRGLD